MQASEKEPGPAGSARAKARTANLADGSALLEGGHPDQALVAVEHRAGREEDAMVLFYRTSSGIRREQTAFHPFCWVADAGLLKNSTPPAAFETLSGAGELRCLAVFKTWKTLHGALAHLRKETGRPPSDAAAPYFVINDPVQQFLMRSGRTLFKQLEYDALRRMQVDIETETGEGFDFPNAHRESDRIIAIAMADQSGWSEVLSARDRDERELLAAWVSRVREHDPDVIEGHNIFRFDIPYLVERARRHGVRLALGRDGSEPRVRPGRFTAGERSMNYPRTELCGRHVVDTYFLAQTYDVSSRALEGYGLKEVAAHFGLAAPGRTYLPGHEIGKVFREQPERLEAYARDDVIETRALSDMLAPVYFAQTRLLPMSYQQTCTRGNGAKIDALLLREYLRRRRAVPRPDTPREFPGGYTDLFFQGLARNVHHCDVRSLYPSLMLKDRIGPRRDELGVFLDLLRHLRRTRFEAREEERQADSEKRRHSFNALQTGYKVLINSFYGYLGFAGGRFNDFEAAEKVTAAGRELLRAMIEWVRRHGGKPVEIDTDGIYFVPPDAADRKAMQAFRAAFRAWLPEGIEIEFDGEYAAMFSYKMKNYALLTHEGEMIIKGAALKSRGLEPFQRDFLREMLRLKLDGKDADLPALKQRYADAIHNRTWPIEKFAKTETLREAPAVYASKLASGKGRRSAASELALHAGRKYEAGDQVTYYVTGTAKKVSVHDHARRVCEWNPDRRDENTAFYLAKLEALYQRFAP